MPSATPNELAAAIIECIDAGARVVNLSLGLAGPSTREEQYLAEALHHAVSRSVIVVAAAGNQGTIGSSALTRSSVGHSGRGLRPSGQTDERVEPGPLHRQARFERARRWHYQSRRRRTIAHPRRNERCGAVCDWRDGVAVVGISLCNRSANQAGRFGLLDAAGLGSATAGCCCGLQLMSTANARW